MSDFFRAYQASGMTVPTYFIESTAPNNVDDLKPSNASAMPDGLKLIDPPDSAVDEIAKSLANASEPNLVVMVHGFNTPRFAALNTYAVAAQAIEADDAIKRHEGLVCVGYRWPSEKMTQPFGGSWDALPTLPTWILYFGAAITVVSGGILYLTWDSRHFWIGILMLFGWTFAGLVLTAVLLRAIVYFRDIYRATNYGVPELIQIIRAIDSKIFELRSTSGNREVEPRVHLSFIGHSMGGFVVTNTIRTLSDMFATPSSLSTYGAKGYVESGAIRKALISAASSA